LIGSSFLQANSDAYEWLVGNIDQPCNKDKFEKILSQVVAAAQFAADFHTGRFADGSIENIGFQIGSMLTSRNFHLNYFPRSAAVNNRRRHILHVTCFVLAVGGHTRMLYHWIKNDRSSVHSVVLLDQTEPIPQWFSKALAFGGGELIQLPPNLPSCQKALRLITLARQNADLVILHHIWYDVVPTVAFACGDCPPVAVLNHADHVFWLGSSVADMVISLRTAGADHTARRRFISCNAVLPIPLPDQPSTRSRSDAREALGIGESEVVLLSVGRGTKYYPNGSFDFIATVSKILNSQKNAHLYIVGESAEGIRPYLRTEIHNRLHFVGILEDPSLFRDAADVYLESFPFGSTTSLLEAALKGLPVVPAYAPLFPLLVGSADSISDILSTPESEQEYIERTIFLIAQPNLRDELGQALRARILVDHVGEGWLNQLDKLYKGTDRLAHSPKSIENSSCLFTPEDIGLSMWNVLSEGQTYFGKEAADQKITQLLHAGRVTKRVGNYAKAREFALRALRETPFRMGPWRLLGAAMAGDNAPIIRKVLRKVLNK
jgi:glycosyltransferase involved in cell wall biosynthesis